MVLSDVWYKDVERVDVTNEASPSAPRLNLDHNN